MNKLDYYSWKQLNSVVKYWILLYAYYNKYLYFNHALLRNSKINTINKIIKIINNSWMKIIKTKIIIDLLQYIK